MTLFTVLLYSIESVNKSKYTELIAYLSELGQLETRLYMSAVRHLCQTQAECPMFLMSTLTKKAFCSIRIIIHGRESFFSWF